ncbi:hypothetical protein CPZ29_28070 [Klebsiella oxytoca]|nr:hypothetical protein CPZ29_28070 [Klebsiella oxytoca]
MMSLWDALRMNMMISYQELVRTFPNVDLHKELCGILIKKECEYSFSVMHGEGDILDAFIRKHRTKQ